VARDILARLREQAEWYSDGLGPLCGEAADEIELLRRCRTALEAIMEAHGPGTLASDELYAMATDALREG
jgi:hypothetical protein